MKLSGRSSKYFRNRRDNSAVPGSQQQAVGTQRKCAGSPGPTRQRGSAITEAALIFLPMMIMCLGIVDVSFAVFIQSTLTTATREGARFAVTFSPSYSGTSCAVSQATCITSVVQYNASGFLNGTNSNYITVNYYTANDLTNPADSCNAGTCTLNPNGVATAALPQTLSNGIVVTRANQPGNVVEVVVAGYPWNWLFPVHTYTAGSGYGIGPRSISLGARSTDVLGALAVGVTIPPGP
jgi:Flp pilus assembly protein TadG